MIKLINIDLDGTLLYDHYIVSKENLLAIQYAKKNGILVGINSGRNSLSSQYFSEMTGCIAPVVCCNGAIIIDKKVPLFESVLQQDIILRCIEISKETKIPFHAFSYNRYYIVGESYENDVVSSWNKNARELISMGVEYLKDYQMAKNISNICKITFSSINDQEKKKVDEIIKRYDDWDITYSLSSIIEITNKGIDKGFGTSWLGKKFGIEMKDIACIGDDLNDISMMKNCGYPIAMGDAHKLLKKMAKYVTLGCKENGVAKAIYDLVGGKYD